MMTDERNGVTATNGEKCMDRIRIYSTTTYYKSGLIRTDKKENAPDDDSEMAVLSIDNDCNHTSHGLV